MKAILNILLILPAVAQAQGFSSGARLFPEENLPLINFFECIPQPAAIKAAGVNKVTLRESEWDPYAQSWTDTVTYSTTQFDEKGRETVFTDFHIHAAESAPSVHRMEYDPSGRLETWTLNSHGEWTSVERYYYSPDVLFLIAQTQDFDGILETVNNYQQIVLLPDGKTDFIIQGTCDAATPVKFPCSEQEPISVFQFRYEQGRVSMVDELDAQTAPLVDTSAPLIERHVYQYDEAGRMVSLTFSYGDEPSGEVQTFSYDAQGRIEKMEMRVIPENTFFRAVTILYDERGLPVTVSHLKAVEGQGENLETRRFYEWK